MEIDTKEAQQHDSNSVLKQPTTKREKKAWSAGLFMLLGLMAIAVGFMFLLTFAGNGSKLIFLCGLALILYSVALHLTKVLISFWKEGIRK